MRRFAFLAFLVVVPASAGPEGESRTIACYSGERALFEGCGTDVILGPNQVTFTVCGSLRRTWIHADCLVSWTPAQRP